MDSSLILSNILNPPVLFFFLGMLAIFVQSDLEIPNPLPKLFSLYLLVSIGFKGGHELFQSGLSPLIIATLLAAVFMASIVPIYSFFILRIKLDTYNAAAIAATYGSISAVTFITASSLLDKLQIPYGGHMVAALALMESPAIVVGLILVRVFAAKKAADEVDEAESTETSWGEVLREAFLNGSVLLLIGSVIIGVATGLDGWNKVHLFVEKDLFYGALMFFLLDMGLVAARRIQDLRQTGMFLIGFAVLMPLFNALLGILLAKAIGMGQGDALLFAVLCASASYIAVPAAMRMTVPEANPSLYVSMALAITFPFNIIVGIPIYLQAINMLGM
ncbi:sodium-dependent bicarbonate transport family permease [Chamaesiphon sp. VAR_48_metabat_135_sub]|uniref:sodium-dependent bicarbonate transport family permease n=1 Tax=Chamaesiphon sp. VAR_48_metabat_135_sub TaxID=2964699 RepID=UPI00286B7D24|nr:sodium-dependent bicarbonate transport family permease [Chamaesiphon sp. VAR_48_metabat_135_sub]